MFFFIIPVVMVFYKRCKTEQRCGALSLWSSSADTSQRERERNCCRVQKSHRFAVFFFSSNLTDVDEDSSYSLVILHSRFLKRPGWGPGAWGRVTHTDKEKIYFKTVLFNISHIFCRIHRSPYMFGCLHTWWLYVPGSSVSVLFLVL